MTRRSGLILALTVLGCTGDSDPPPIAPSDGRDTTPPAAIADLTVATTTDTSVTLTWTATGDDGDIGRAAHYDLRYAGTMPGIEDPLWEIATPVLNAPTPAVSGSVEQITVAGLTTGTTYFFGLQVADEIGNWSPRSFLETQTATAADGQWSNQFDEHGMDQYVACLASYDGSLVAGGHFQTAGTVQAMGIARWDGTTWSTMGRFQQYGDIAFGPKALAPHHGSLVAVGSFRFVNNDDESWGGRYISAWEDGRWTWIGEGVSDGDLGYTECSTVLSLGDQLIVGGHFQKAGPVVNASNVAAWDGSSWSALRAGLDDHVYALGSFNSELVAGGFFGRSGGSIVNKVARFDASAYPWWYPLGSGISGGSQEHVYALTTFNGELIAAGDFAFAGGVWAPGVARWNGAWQPLGEPGDGWDDEYPRVWALAVYNGRLIIGGDYSDRHRSCIASWDGSTWDQLGTGVGTSGDSVFSLTVHDGKLFVGGQFTRAGHTTSRNIACWEE